MENYEEALEKAKDLYSRFEGTNAGNVLEEIFPELIKTEDERIRKEITFFIAANHKDDAEKAHWLYWLEKQGGNKSVEWCKNDDVMLKQLIRFFEDKDTILQHDANLYAGWLKSLKDRVVPQPKQEWGEEDEAIKKELISYLAKKKSRETDGYAIWLKSLKPQKRWISVDKEVYVKEPVLAQKKDKSDQFIANSLPPECQQVSPVGTDPASEDLEEEIDRWSKEQYYNDSEKQVFAVVARHFADWQRKRITENNLLLPFSEYDNLLESINRQKKEGYLAGFKQGTIDAKDELMKRNAIDGICISNGAECGSSIESSAGMLFLQHNTFDVGDKVKLIIIKEQ